MLICSKKPLVIYAPLRSHIAVSRTDSPMTETPYEAGFRVGLLGWRIEDDWGGWPTEYAGSWDDGIAIWRRSNSYWGA
jgi:hypothetical protein